MDTFPFTEAEWDAVREAARSVVNSTFAEDTALRASQFTELQAVLAGLRGRYGDHPVLLETEADFTDTQAGRLALYERAKQAAVARGLPTLSIRLALARLLLEEVGHPAAARGELLACRDELAGGDESDREAWSSMLAECDRLLSTLP